MSSLRWESVKTFLFCFKFIKFANAFYNWKYLNNFYKEVLWPPRKPRTGRIILVLPAHFGRFYLQRIFSLVAGKKACKWSMHRWVGQWWTNNKIYVFLLPIPRAVDGKFGPGFKIVRKTGPREKIMLVCLLSLFFIQFFLSHR